MSVITLTVYCIFSVLALIIYRKISHPVVIFNLIWTALIAVSQLELIGISVPPASTYQIFLKGGIAFNISAVVIYLLSLFIRTNSYEGKNKTILSDKTKQNILLVVNIILLVYYLYKLVRVYILIGEAGNYLGVRGFYYSTDNFASSFEYNVVTFVFDPFIYLNSVIFALNTRKRTYKYYTLILIFINMVLRTVISGGRMIMFEFALCIIIVQITSLYKSRKDRLSRNTRNKRILLIFVLFVLFIIASYITELRGGTEKSLAGNGISTVISNFTGSFSYFSVLLNHGKILSGLNGRATFAGIVDPFIMILHYVKLTSVDIAQNSVGTILSEFYLLGNHSYNAMPTMYYFFITDFGEFGIIAGPVLLSLYCFIFDRIRNYFGNYKSFGLYIMMLLTIIESPMTWLPFKTSFIIANILIILFVSTGSLAKNNKPRGD